MNTVTNCVVKNYHNTHFLSINSIPLTLEQMKSDVLCYIYFINLGIFNKINRVWYYLWTFFKHFMKRLVAGLIRDYNSP